MKTRIIVYFLILLGWLAILATAKAQPKDVEYKIMVPFVENTTEGVYRDAHIYTADEWSKLDKKSVDDASKAKAAQWKTFVIMARNSAPAVAPKFEDMTETELDMKVKSLEAETLAVKIALTNKVAVRLQAEREAFTPAIESKEELDKGLKSK